MMWCVGRKVTRLVAAGASVVCVCWLVSVSEWAGAGGSSGWEGDNPGAPSTMRTIIAYSAGKQAELDRPSPVTCDRLPALPDLPHINRTWSPGRSPRESSWQPVHGTKVSLFSAYYDQRTSQHYIRILALFKGRNFSTEEPLFCQTRPTYDDTVEVVAAKPLEIWWHEWDISSTEVETPLLLTCPLTGPLYGPSIVSIVTEPCDDPTNAFELEPIQRKVKMKRKFTICVKDMNFDKDIMQNLIEWIEINRIIGVDKIDIYIDNISKETESVLLYYRDMGFVRLYHVPVTFGAGRSLWQRRRDHIVTYNDCMYRNILESEFVIPLDIDEIILPKIANTLPELVKRLTDQGWDPSQYSAILVQNAFFFDFMQESDKYKKFIQNKSRIYIKRDDVRIKESIDLDNNEILLIDNKNDLEDKDNVKTDLELNEEYKLRCGRDLPVPKLVRHVVRSSIVSPVGYYSKSLMVTKKVLTAFNHYPLASLGASGFTGWSAPITEVQLNHYKESCNTTVLSECARYGRRTTLDLAALRLRKSLVAALAKAICLPKIHDD